MGTTWSISRDQTLHTCERRYYFQYLAPAKINSCDETLREIAFLKKLKNIPMWQGELFHALVAEYLESARRKRLYDPCILLDKMRERVKREWKFSVSISAWPNPRSIDNKGNIVLFEHEYNEPSVVTDYTEVIDHLEKLFYKFISWAEE